MSRISELADVLSVDSVALAQAMTLHGHIARLQNQLEILKKDWPLYNKIVIIARSTEKGADHDLDFDQGRV